jgi:hypothetical protein
VAEKDQIHAVHTDDQIELLEHLGLADRYRAGELLCKGCGEPINAKGLGAIQMIAGELVVSCADLDCGREGESD